MATFSCSDESHSVTGDGGGIGTGVVLTANGIDQPTKLIERGVSLALVTHARLIERVLKQSSGRWEQTGRPIAGCAEWKAVKGGENSMH